MSKATENAKTALVSMKNFDINTLLRKEELGNRLNFSGVVPHVSKLKALYNKLSPEVVDELPDHHAENIATQIQETFKLFSEIMEFDPAYDSVDNRDALIEAVLNNYIETFDTLAPLVAYGSSVTATIQRLENEFQEVIQQARDGIADFSLEMEKSREDRNKEEARLSAMIENVRVASAEVGVSQHAIHFQNESESHSEQATHWRWATIVCGSVLLLYAGATFFSEKLFNPDDMGSEIQLVVAKILLFAVLSYGVFLSTRNFMSHTHNAIVNKHRQNALMTFKALVDAAVTEENRDVILAHASVCIFSPQDTGYTKSDGKPPAPDPPVVGLISKMMKQQS